MFFSHTSKNRSNLIKKKQSKIFWEGNSTKFPSTLRPGLKTYHCIHFVGLQACKWSRSKTLWFLDSGAVENNKHQALSFPISVGFKRTPYDTKSYSKPPGQTVFVCVSLTISALNIGFGRWGRGLKQLRAKQADRTLARGTHEGPGGWPPGGGCKRTAPPCLRKFGILRSKYA